MNREFLRGLGLEDEQVDKIMAEHGKAINANKEMVEDYSNLKSEKEMLEKSLSSLQDEKSSLSDQLAQLETEKADYENTVNKYKTQNMRYLTASKHGIPLDLADRLQGDDEESLQADAERLSKYIQQPSVQPMKSYDSNIDSKEAGLSAMLDNMLNKGE